MKQYKETHILVLFKMEGVANCGKCFIDKNLGTNLSFRKSCIIVKIFFLHNKTKLHLDIMRLEITLSISLSLHNRTDGKTEARARRLWKIFVKAATFLVSVVSELSCLMTQS